MAQTTATGLIMPAVPRGYYRRPYTTAGQPGYTPWRTSTGLAQPGDALGDATPALADVAEGGDEMLGSLEVGVVAIPHFPQEAWQFFSAHAWEAVPLVKYTQQAAKYAQVVLPAPLGSDEVGLPEDDEMVSVSASENMRYKRAHAKEARGAMQAHEADQTMGDTEVSQTGATGVWSIAGSV